MPALIFIRNHAHLDAHMYDKLTSNANVRASKPALTHDRWRSLTELEELNWKRRGRYGDGIALTHNNTEGWGYTTPESM